MAPFDPPTTVLSGFKERPEALLVQGDRLYVGTATGNLFIYEHSELSENGSTLVDTKKALSRRPIDQLGYIKDVNSLVILSETIPTLYPLPSFAPPTPLTRAKGAFSFAVHSSVHNVAPSDAQGGANSVGRAGPIPTMVTQLIVGCRRKVVVYTWKDGEAQEVRETVLPHSPRVVVFLDSDNVCFAYSPTEYALFSISKLTTLDITTPISASASSMGAFSGITGYMTLGLGSRAKPGLVRLSDTEALIVKDNQGFIIGTDGKQTKPETIDWPSPPDEVAFVNPYIFSILPPGTVPVPENGGTPPGSAAVAPQSSLIPSPVVQVISSLTTQPVQTLPFPPTPVASPTATCTIRLLTSSPAAKAPLFLVTTPSDRTAATAEGSSIWQFRMRSWGDQIDELVQRCLYSEALLLLDTLDQGLLPDKDQRRTHIRALHAVSQFRLGKFDDAINSFIELDLNPAKVVALYPERIAGRLSVPPDDWIPLFGGPANQSLTPKNDDAMSTKSKDDNASKEKLLEQSPSPATAVRTPVRRGTAFGALLSSSKDKDDDTASISGRKKVKQVDDFSRSVDALWRYLTDRRPKVAGALSAVHIAPAQSHQWPFLSETSTEELFALPNIPLALLTPEQLVRFAQIVDTALFKSYLVTQPALLGALCRLANWCEVSEVEEELRAREKFAELIYLYNGKKMHAKALNLLHQLSEKETDMRDKLDPSISYLRKLGPEYINQVFESSRWIFKEDRDMAFQIFTSDDVELPRTQVTDYLEKIDPTISARYIEYLIDEKGEESPAFHDRLAELYLNMTLSARKRGDETKGSEVYSKLLRFIDSTDHYRPDRLYGLLSENLYEARAVLLGRMGRHDHALELYVYKLRDYSKAEDSTSAPPNKAAPNLLQPALDLISRHSPRLDSIETLQLLPPLVTARDVRPFLQEALRVPIFDTHVIRDVHKARNEQVARKLMLLESRRVKVTDSRICPQCHKRLGSSVIAVHAPRGEVTHYQCRDAFARRLNDPTR
ncbi:vacuolar sorting protein 39 domain 1-domain-containing protein [Suillus ampliporus]|nr:vacuolar sorting protein 39 domain 1-domain-containing protein [Suillus ampliporus]